MIAWLFGDIILSGYFSANLGDVPFDSFGGCNPGVQVIVDLVDNHHTFV